MKRSPSPPRTRARTLNPRLRDRPLGEAIVFALVQIYTDPGLPTALRIEAAGLALEWFHGPPPAIAEDCVQ